MNSFTDIHKKIKDGLTRYRLCSFINFMNQQSRRLFQELVITLFIKMLSKFLFDLSQII